MQYRRLFVVCISLIPSQLAASATAQNGFVSYALKDSRKTTDTSRTWMAIPGAQMT